MGQQGPPQRAALYCRVSTADQSCERQGRDLAAFARRAGYEVVDAYRETASGARPDRAERREVLALDQRPLAQRRGIDAVLVTELSRWGRGTTDLMSTLKELEARRVSLVALNGMAFDLSTPHGRMVATPLAGIAEFERELAVERIRSGIAAAKARGKRLGRRPGQRPKSDRLAPEALALVAQGRSYSLVAREAGLSKNTVAGIVERRRTPPAPAAGPVDAGRVRRSGLSTYGPPRPQVISAIPPASLLQRIRPRSRAPCQDGDTRGALLVIGPAFDGR